MNVNCLKYAVFISCLLLETLKVFSQGVPKGIFLKDSIKVGEPIRFSLTFKHDKKLEMFFPEKNFNYFPFELISKEYFDTRTIGNYSVDSTIYNLRTFETKLTINYFLPVSIIEKNGDTTYLKSTNDVVFLKPLLTAVDTNVSLIEDTRIHPLPVKINYPFYLLIVAIVLIIASLLFLLFRKPILKRYKLYFLNQGHQNFIITYQRLERDFNRKPELQVMEKGLSLWKNYLSKLENIPINTYTTTEIITLYKNKELVEGLQIIDRSIYRGQISPDSASSMTVLKQFSNNRYQKVKKAIIND